MSESALPLDDELLIAEAQGERAIASLRADDQFFYRSTWFTILSFQRSLDPEKIFVRCTDGVKVREFLWHPFLVFPALLTDEHAAEGSRPAF